MPQGSNFSPLPLQSQIQNMPPWQITSFHFCANDMMTCKCKFLHIPQINALLFIAAKQTLLIGSKCPKTSVYYTRAVSATLVTPYLVLFNTISFFITFKALHSLAAAYLSFTSRLIPSSPLAVTAVSHSRLLSVGGRSFSVMTYPNRSVTALLLLLSRPGLKHFPFTQCYPSFKFF